MTTAKRSATWTPHFIRLSSMLFVIEFVRSALLISFLPAYAVGHLGISLTAVGLAVSIHYLADTGVKVAAGYLLDRFSSRLMLHLSFAASLAGLWAVFYGHQPWLLVVGAVLLGIGGSPVWLICLSSIRDQGRGSQMGAIYTVWLASLGAGPIALNFVMDQGYALSFWLLMALLIVGWGIALRSKFEAVSALPTVSLKDQLKQLKGRLTLMKPLVPGMVLQTAAAGLLVPVLPTFATNQLGLDYSGYSLVLIVGGVVTAAGLIPMGRLSDRWGHRRFLVAGFFGLAAALIMLLSSSGLPSTMLLASVLGLSYAIVLPSWNAVLSTFVPNEQKGTGWGVLSSIEGIGVMIGPMLGGWVAGRFNETVTVAVSACLLAAIALFYLLVPQGRLIPGKAAD
ncbi:MFS transporter [Paenibacillus sp. GYB003]|uniref:MFS transporter n=1 Tax=Paenibacillus sp. GYB003 TaxID=2994392 RepID=UPI002F96854E